MAARNGRVSVVAVIVSYNRRELLLEAVQAVRDQTSAVDGIVVVDNASTDGSADAVRGLPGVDLVELARNVGGAGGFAVGLAHAVAVRGADWVWLMDDDTIPTATALEELLRTLGRIPAAALGGSRVIWTDGSDHPMNTPRENPFATRRARSAADAAGGLAVRSSSFVSMLVSAPEVLRAGLPIADYFIWNDDFDFSTRVLRGRPGMYVPASVVVHKTKVLGSTDVDPGPRFYYEVRNKLWLFLRSRGLSLPEKAVYGASTLLRWIRTVARSRDRRLLLSQVRPAFRDGLRAPRPNVEVLAGLGAGTDAVLAFERLRTSHG